MTDQERLDELIDRWEELRRQGREIDVEELVLTMPAWAAQLRRSIRALKATDWLSQPLDDEPAATLGDQTSNAARTIASPDASEKVCGVLGDYQLLEKIGGGGMGRVYKARHRTMQRLVALKILPGVDRSPEAVRRFQREIQAMARLTHPNIVTAYDAGQCEGTHFLVMELVDGSDLAQHVNRHGPLPIAVALDYTRQVALGLEYAHREGVIHRDIKPSNLLLDNAGAVKILDLGLARFGSQLCGAEASAASQLTQRGSVFGTIDYMAPEQAANASQADPRSDIYSLGCTLHFLLTGQPVFAGQSAVERLIAHRERSAPASPTPARRAAAGRAPLPQDGGQAARGPLSNHVGGDRCAGPVPGRPGAGLAGGPRPAVEAAPGSDRAAGVGGAGVAGRRSRAAANAHRRDRHANRSARRHRRLRGTGKTLRTGGGGRVEHASAGGPLYADSHQARLPAANAARRREPQ